MQGQPLDAYDLSHWRSAGLGGDMIRMPPLKAFVEAFGPAGFSDKAFVASYGMAEATLALSMAPLGKGLRAETLDVERLERDNLAVDAPEGSDRARDFARCGPALPDHFLDVRDETGAVLPERGVGRIFAKGPSVMSGYFANPEETARVLSADGWLDTGDIGFKIEGEIVITGRAKDLIILNGRNIWPQDLEWTADHEIDGLRSGDVLRLLDPRRARRPDRGAGPGARRRRRHPRRPGRAGVHPAAHPSRRRGQGQAGRRPRPAPDFFWQAEPLEGQDRVPGRRLR